MAEICRVLLVTLLLCLYWRPSVQPVLPKIDKTGAPKTEASRDTQGRTTGTSSTTLVTTTPFWREEATRPPPETDQGPWIKTTSTTVDPEPQDSRVSAFSPGENCIITLLSSYFHFGCKGAVQSKPVPIEGTFDAGQVYTSQAYTDGENFIIDLLLSFFRSDCKRHVVTPRPGSIPDGRAIPGENRGTVKGYDYPPGVDYIIKLLATYISVGCKAAADTIVTGGAKEKEYTSGQNYTIKLLSAYLRSGCKVAATGKAEEGGSSGAAGRHVQSVVLAFSLLIFGVCLTRIEL